MKNDNKRNQLKEIDSITPGNLLTLYTLGYMIKKNSSCIAREIILETDYFPIWWRVSNGSFYYVFNKLKKNKYIKRSQNEDVDMLSKHYRITNAGKKYYMDNIDKYKDLLNTTADFYKNVAETLPDRKNVVLNKSEDNQDDEVIDDILNNMFD